MSDEPRTCAQLQDARIMKLSRLLSQAVADRDRLLAACDAMRVRIECAPSQRAEIGWATEERQMFDAAIAEARRPR